MVAFHLRTLRGKVLSTILYTSKNQRSIRGSNKKDSSGIINSSINMGWERPGDSKNVKGFSFNSFFSAFLGV